MLDPFWIQPIEVGRAKIVKVNPLAKAKLPYGLMSATG